MPRVRTPGIVGGVSGQRLAAVVVVGTRPEAIKLVPLILAMRDSESVTPVVVSSGQHHAMVSEVLALAGIKADADLWVGAAHASLNARVAAFMRRLEDYLRGTFPSVTGESRTREQVLAGTFPAAMLVHGDTSSAFAAALAGFHLRIPVAHVEAGLRTGGSNLSPFPEELNRQLISCIAAVHYAPTADNEENLVREDIPANQIFVTGNTGIDALQWAAGLDVPFEDPRLAAVVESNARVIVATAHRRENWGKACAGSPRASRASRPSAPTSTSCSRCIPIRACGRTCLRRSSRARTCCCASRSRTPRWPGCSGAASS